MTEYKSRRENVPPLFEPRWGSRTPKGLLYHYTSLEGFLGIIESDCLRATHIRYMNDSKEFIDALEHLDDFLDEFDKGAIPALRSFLHSKLSSFLHSAVPVLSGRLGPYIISFTDDEAQASTPEQIPGDRLSQWRAYSGHSKGFSLGFDCCALDASGQGNTWVVRDSMAYMVDCLYSKADKRNVFQGAGELMAAEVLRVLNFTESDASSSDPSGNSDISQPHELSGDHSPEIASMRRNLLFALLINASTFKDPAYSEEREWRIVLNLSSSESLDDKVSNANRIPVKFRGGILGVTPYVEFPLGLTQPTSPLRKIVVGPTPHMDQAVRSVQMLLQDRGIKLKIKDEPQGVEVIASQIPYRNW